MIIRPIKGKKYYKSEDACREMILEGQWYLIIFMYKSRTKVTVLDSYIKNSWWNKIKFFLLIL